MNKKELPEHKPIRVAQILNRMDSGGIEAVVMNYYRCMDHTKVQFDFYFFEGSTFPQRQELERLGAGIYPVPAYSHPLNYHRALLNAFRRKHYAIVHAHLSTMSLFALFAAWRAGVPKRICHNHTTAHWGEGKKTLLKYFLRPFNKIFATDYFACGEKAGRWMYGNRCFEAGKVYVMPNAIDTGKFAYDIAARNCLRKELAIPDNGFVVGHVGRFMYQKNHMFLLQIFQQVLQQKKDSWLLLVGEGELMEQIQTVAEKMGISEKIRFVGARSDVNKLYSVMDVFCLPSFYEGLPVVALEAQANNLPCVFSDQMTEEVILSTGVQRLPLGHAAKWARIMVNMHRNESSSDIIQFDIAEQSKKLGQYYLDYSDKLRSEALKV